MEATTADQDVECDFIQLDLVTAWLPLSDESDYAANHEQLWWFTEEPVLQDMMPKSIKAQTQQCSKALISMICGSSRTPM